MENILVLGGAGYIGSHICKLLKANGYLPIVLDNLVNGHYEAVKYGPFYKGNISDLRLLETILNKHPFNAVMHLAAYCYVGESMANPSMYYVNNVKESICFLEFMRSYKIENIIFSSSCATYGEPNEIPITEQHHQNPINPYGRTKLIVEKLLEDYQRSYGINFISLRYFNAAGADPDCDLGEDHRPETHIIPIILQTALGIRDCFYIYGKDYHTEDGTCIRDYIHVSDLATAHLKALERLLNQENGGYYNLGNGHGYSVNQIIEAACNITGKNIRVEYENRRAGDPEILVGSFKKIQKILNWKQDFSDINTIITTAWEWHKKHPNGYSK